MENKMDLLANEVRTKNLDHLGLVAATIDDLGIVEKIDAEVKISEQSSMTIGQRVKAMILNGLGFTNYRLYMVAKFFETKPVDRLFSENFNSEQINDDALGRCLDKIYEKGSTSLYAKIAFEIAQEQGLLEKGHRHDSTTLTVYGDYENNANNKGINITYGHSKDHRPDLKQVTMMLTMTKSNHFPLWMSALHGNASDKKSFQEIDKKVRAFRKQLKLSEDALVVGDSALYCSELLERSKEDLQFFWLTRVPETITSAKQLCSLDDNKISWTDCGNGYKSVSLGVTRNEIKQRWQLIFSQQAYERGKKTFMYKLEKQKIKCEAEFKKIKQFACEADAKKAISKLEKKWNYHKADYLITPVYKHKKAGRPKKTDAAAVTSYEVTGEIVEKNKCVKEALNRKGRFILATNQLDGKQLPDDQILSEYKGQAALEKGFRFLKDPWFMASSIYLKNNSRIEALMMIMTLCLMVYNFAEQRLRKMINENEDTLPSQTGKKTKTPSLRWVFQLMEGITEVIVNSKNLITKIIANINNIHRKIIDYFGSKARIIYGIEQNYQNSS